MKSGYDDQLVQSFPHRCPYCDEPLSYDQLKLSPGENPIHCPSCKRIFIKVISDPDERGDG